MNQVFLSYASSEKSMARDIAMALIGRGFSVFFDENSLPPSGDYHQRIKKAVQDSDVVVFLITPESVSPGAYTLTELKYAQQKWKHPKHKVVPVLLRSTTWEDIPAYLKSVTLLEPAGNVAAEITAAVEELSSVIQPMTHSQAQIDVHGIELVEGRYPTDGWTVVFSQQGKILVDNALWMKGRMRQIKLQPRPSHIHGEAGARPVFSLDESAIFETAGGGRLIRWNISTFRGECSIVYEADDTDFWAGKLLAFSRDGEKLVTGGENLTVLDAQKWAQENLFWLDDLASDVAGYVRDLAFSPNGSLLAVTVDEGIVFLQYPGWNVFRTVKGPSDKMLTSTRFSPSGNYVVSSSQETHIVEIRTVEEGNLVQSLHAHLGGVIGAHFFVDDTLIVTAGLRDGFVKFWRLPSGKVLAESRVSEGGVSDLQVSPENALIATRCCEPDPDNEQPEWIDVKYVLKFWNVF